MSTVASPPRSPFKGLSAFEDTDLDALFFFGREREAEVIVANLLASRLTVLYGESGVGKSSVLRAAVVRELRRVAPQALVAVHSGWADDPLAPLAAARETYEAYLILDQFEEYFVYHGDADGPGTLVHELPELLHANARVNVLISLREDALAQLDVFNAQIPAVFANRLRLEHLDRDAARAAILGPVRRWNELMHENVEVEPELVESVLDEVGTGRIDLGAGGAALPSSDGAGRIEAPYLQLVSERIWEAEREESSTTLRLATLQRLGGAATIVREHVESALDELDAHEKDVAARMFDHLVTPSGTKIAHRVDDLAQYAAVPQGALLAVLGTLNRERILRTVDGAHGSGERYEIFHDVLAEPVLAWRARRQLERERNVAARRNRRLLAVAVAALAALAIVAGLAIWAFAERGTAKAEARRARAHELEARALQLLSIDPRTSVRLALTASSLAADSSSESVLRQALIADRLRASVNGSGTVRGVAVSPNGRVVAVAAPHGRVLLADPATGRVVRRLVGRGSFAAVGFAGPNTVVATTSDGQATAWNADSGRRLLVGEHVLAARTPSRQLLLVTAQGQLKQFAHQIQVLRASPNGELLAAALQDPEGHVRTAVFTRDGRLLYRLPLRGITDLAFSPDGRLLASGSFDGTTALWTSQTGRRVRYLRDGGGGVLALSFSPDGALLASGGLDGGVRVWTVGTGDRLFYFPGHTNPVRAVAWSPDGRVLASASLDRTVRLWGVQGLVEAGSPLAVLAGARDAVRSLAFGPAGARLVSGSDDGTARIWDARPEQTLDQLWRARGPVIGAHWAGGRIAAASAGGAIRVWDARSLRPLRTFMVKPPLTAFAVSSNGSTLAVGTASGTRTWDVGTGRAGRGVVVGPVSAVALSPAGDTVAAGDAAGEVRVAGANVWRRDAGARVSDLAFSPAGDQVAAATSRGVVTWSASGRLLHRFPVAGGVVRIAWSADGTLLASADLAETAHLWTVESGRLYHVLRGHHAELTDVVFSSDGSQVATTSLDSDGRLWNVATGKSLRTLRGHAGTVAAIGFSPDGRWVATGGPISVGLWPAETGRLLFYLRGPTKLVTSVSFDRDGRRILSGGRDGTVRIYTCDVCGDLSSLDELARSRLMRNR